MSKKTKKNEEEKIDKENVEKTDSENNETSKPDEAQSQFELLQQENKELNEKNLRLLAEFDNFKKRTVKEKDEMFSYAKVTCVQEFLSILDNFSRAMQSESADENFKKGMAMIMSQFEDTLKKLGVNEIEAMNATFDPNLHHGIKQIEDENFGDNEVCEILQKGYLMGDKVIRPAMVVVANP